jgi:hypothetical protein
MGKKARTEGERTREALARELRERDRKKLDELRRAVAAARATKREALLGVRHLCRGERERLRALAADIRKEAHAVAMARREVKESCQAGRELTRAEARRLVKSAEDRKRLEREHQTSVRRFEKPAKAGPRLAKGVAGGRRSAELRSESDDEVRGSIDPWLVPLWERVKRTIRATARKSRTEAFLDWVHDHPEAQYELAEEEAAAELRRLEAEHAAHARAVRHPRRYRRKAAELAADVPF